MHLFTVLYVSNKQEEYVVQYTYTDKGFRKILIMYTSWPYFGVAASTGSSPATRGALSSHQSSLYTVHILALYLFIYLFMFVI